VGYLVLSKSLASESPATPTAPLLPSGKGALNANVGGSWQLPQPKKGTCSGIGPMLGFIICGKGQGLIIIQLVDFSKQ